MNRRKHLALACMALAFITAGTSMAADNTGSGGVITYTDSNGLNPVASPPYAGGYVVHTFTNSGTLNIPLAATLTWNPGGGGNWDTATANWIGDASTFISDGSQDVIFDKTAGGTITISAGMQPASTTVSATSGTYTFNGGPITGSGGLTKSGAGQLTMNTANNTYTGKTSVQGGTLLTGGPPTSRTPALPASLGRPQPVPTPPSTSTTASPCRIMAAAHV